MENRKNQNSQILHFFSKLSKDPNFGTSHSSAFSTVSSKQPRSVFSKSADLGDDVIISENSLLTKWKKQNKLFSGKF